MVYRHHDTEKCSRTLCLTSTCWNHCTDLIYEMTMLFVLLEVWDLMDQPEGSRSNMWWVGCKESPVIASR